MPTSTRSSRTIRRDGVNVISAYDLRAIAQAVELKTRLGFETVASRWARHKHARRSVDALGMGIDHAVHLQDRAFAGSDTLATARALAQWLKRESSISSCWENIRSTPRPARSVPKSPKCSASRR